MASSFDKTIAQEQAKVTGATSKQAQLVEAAKGKRELLGRISQANAMHAAQEKEQQFADLSSLSGRLGLDPEGVPHQILNLGASAVSGAATLAAGAVALPTNIAAIGMDLLLTDEERQAMARRLRGEELATDAAILDKRGQTGYTAAEIYSKSKDQRDAGETIAQFGDISSIVHKGKQNEVNAELSKVWDEHGAEVSKGWENIKSGEVLTGLKQLVPSGASLLMEGMTKFADNPEAASEYIAQNLPQLIGGAMTGGSLFLANTTAGYAIDTYNKGVLEYEKTHDGAAPPADVRNTMLGQAALIMLSEYYGAQSVAKGISRIPGVKEGVAATVGKAGIIPAAARTTGAVAGGYVNEGFTEGVQTYLEGEIKGKPASGEDIFKSVTIGGLVGSAISGGASTATEALTGGDSNNTLDPVKRDKDPAVMAAVAKAREAGDLASLTDTSNIAYSPTTAVDLLYAITQDSTKTPEEKADAIKKSADVVATLEENVADAKANLERFSPEGLKLSSERKARGIERLAALDPNDPDIEAKTEQLKNALSTVEKDLTANPKQKKAEYAKELKYYEATLSKAQELLSQTNTLSDSENTALAPEIAAVQTAAPGVDTTAARESIIVRAMASTQHLTSDAAIALADNADNGFKPEQREFLRAYAAAKTARAEEAATKSTSQVNSEIVDGTNTDSQFKNMGIKQYRAKIADALKQGSTAIAEEVSAKFTNWANVHASKAEAAKKAIQGINGNRTIVRLKDEEGKSGLWQLAPKPSAQMSAEEKAQYAEVKVMNSPKLVGVISAEATSLLATSKELSLAVGIQKKNGKAAPVDPLAPAPTVQVPVAVVTPPPAATPPVVVPVAPTPSPTSSGKANPSEFTLMSGGAKGADTLWDSIGRTFGLTKAKHFWMGQTTPIGNTEISEDDTKEGKEKVTLAARAMGRIAPTHNVQSPLLIRNWSQVKYADAVFAVTTMLSAGSGMNYDKKALIRQGKGGTGYAIEMAIQAGKPVYVFDQERGRWFANLGKGWVNSDTPTLTKNFAGIGTREINAAGKQAIRDVFEKTFSGAPLNIAPAVVVPVAPVTPPPKPTAPSGTSTAAVSTAGVKPAPTPVVPAPVVTPDPVSFTEEEAADIIAALTEGDMDSLPDIDVELGVDKARALIAHMLDALLNVKNEDGTPKFKLPAVSGYLFKGENSDHTSIFRAINGLLRGDENAYAKYQAEEAIANGRAQTPTTAQNEENQEDQSLDAQLRAEFAILVAKQKELEAASAATPIVISNPETASSTAATSTVATSQQEDADTVITDEGNVAETVTTKADGVKVATIENLNNEVDPETPAIRRNWATEFLYQVGAGVTTSKPLVMVSNFLTRMINAKNALSENTEAIAEMVAPFITEPLTSEQKTALATFFRATADWAKTIQDNFEAYKDNANPDWTHTNKLDYLFKFTTDAEGKTVRELDESVIVAIAYAAYAHVADKGSEPRRATKDAINLLMGRDKNAPIRGQHWKILGDTMTFQHTLVDSLGARAIEALGLKADDKAATNIIAGLKVALGTQAMVLLENKGIIIRQEVSGEQFENLKKLGIPEDARKGKDTPVFEGKHIFLKFNRKLTKTEDGNRHVVAKAVSTILEANRGTGGIVDQVMQSAHNQQFPGTKANPKTPKIINISGQVTPGKLEVTVLRNQKRAWRIKKAILTELGNISEATVLHMMGVRDAESVHKHVLTRESIQAKNEGLKHEWELLVEFVDMLSQKKSKLDTDIFLTYDVWKQQRVGIKHSAVNPQTSKIVRQILTSPQWKTKVELANADQMNDVYLRIAESLDMKTERSTTENNMPVVMKKLTDPVIVAGVEAIKVLLTDSAVTTEQEQAIADAVEKGNHALFSYNGLKLLAEIQIAEAKGEATVRTDFTGEVDGVTSGTTLNHILYGAGYASSNMGDSLIQGGFITQDSESNFYGDYRTDPASKDVYQGTAKLLHEGVQSLMRKAAEVGGPDNERKIAKLKAIWKITGFADTAGNIANASRNVIKDAVNPIAFGSAVQASVNGLANGFITKVVNGFEKISENAEKSGITAEEVQKQVDAYTGVLRKLTDNNNPKMFTEKTLREWLEYEFSEAEYAALNKAYTETVGKVATKVIETQFGDFLSKTKVMNKAAKSIYDVYEALASGMRKTYIDELVAKGDLLLQPETEASIKAAEAAVKAGKEPKDRRIVTLSKAQEAELQKRLVPFIPFLATSASNPDIKEEGLFVGKIERKSSPDPLMSNVTRFGNQISNRVTDVTTGKGQRVSSPIKSLTIRAIVGVVTDPGVSLISAGTHSLDSDISHTVQKDRHVLNAHDALIDGIGRLSGTARELNKAAFEAVLKYSPLTAMADTLHNLLEAINTAHENGEITAAQMKPIMAALTKNDGLAVVNELSVFAMNADLAKFEFLSLLKTVDHYANEKGAYQLTEEDRAKAVAAYDAAVAGGLHAQRRGTYTILNKLLNVVGSKVVIPGSKVARFSNSSTPKFSGRTRKTTYKTAQAPAPVAVTVAPEYTATVEQDTSNEIASLFEGRKFRSAKALAVEFKKLFKGKGVHTDYLVNLLGIIEKTMPDNLKIMYVTESTSDKHIHGKPDVPVHGWFARGGAIAAEKGSDVDGKKGMGLEGGIIYIMGKGMPGSKLGAELLVHEILHAVLEDAITLGKREIDAEGKLTAAGNLVNDLEQLLVETTAIVNSNPELKQKFGPAVEDIYELLSWGMTNQDFQASVLSQMRAEGNISPETIASLSYKMANAMNAFLMPILNYIRAITGVSIETSGVTRLLVIGSGLLYEAQNIKAAKSAIPGGAISRAMASSNPVTNLTTQEVFEAIDTQAISPAFSNKLVNLLDHIVHKLHGPFGVDYAIQQQGAASNPMDTLMKAMATGIAPFAASVAQGPFISSPQELYVMEQVEATMETALQSPAITTSMAYGELKRLYMEARQEMKTVMSPAEYDFIFGSTTTASREDYLARFVALTLGNEGVNTQMQFTTSKARKALRSDGTIGEKVQNFFLWALEKLTDTVTKATPGLKATTKMEILVSRLVDIDAKQKEALEKEGAVGAQAMKKVADAASEAIVTASSKLLQSRAVKGSKRSLIRMANTLTKVAADGNMELYLDGLQQLRDKVVQDRNGIVAATLGEFRGVKERFLMAMLTVKEQQQVRQKINNSVSESILGAFIDGGIGLTTQTRAAITRVGMRTGLSKLLKHYDIGQIQEMLSDVTVRTARINALTKELGKLGNIGNHFIEQANVTAYHSVTGIARNKMKLANAYAIASGVGTQAHGKLSNSEINSAEVLIEELITLLAIRYSSPTDVAAVSKVMTDEAARGDKNGMLFLLKLAKHYEEESLKHLFNGNKMQMIHGYTPEVVNTNTDVRFATEAEGKLLLLQGYRRAANTNVDFDDRNKEVTGVYTLRNSGKVTPYVSGLLALNSLESKGSSMTITESTSFEEQAKELKKVITTRANTVSIKNAPKQLRDLSSMSENFAVPTIDEKGNVVDFRYMMTSAHRDSILERDNDFSKLMGVHGSKIFDKTKTPAMNTQIVEMLKADYDDGRKLVPHSYILVGVNSPNPEMRAIWASLSSATKDSVKETWGVEGMYVRMDSLDIVFGYSKLSLGNQFNRDMNPRDVKNMRGQAKAMIIDASLNLVATYAKAQLGMNSDDAQEYAKRLSTWINRGELGWRELTAEIKDIIVVKSLVVSASNIMSNLTLLWLKGVPITAMARLHKEGLAGAIAYQEDSSKLLQLQAMLEAGYIETNLEDLKQEIALLEKSIEKNPVTPLVKAGLMPTIVEDLSANEDAYSYKASLSKALENKTSWVNPKIKAAARSVYMTHDTKGYQGLARAAQLSDFVARYVLYTHQTTKKEGKLEHLAAVRDASEAFVNYDMPMHRMTQYLDDMGIMPFMKYFLRIQGVLARATKDEPTRAMALVALGHLIGAGSVVTGSSLFANFMDNPFRAGALNFPFMLDEMVTTSWIN